MVKIPGSLIVIADLMLASDLETCVLILAVNGSVCVAELARTFPSLEAGDH